jgi:hypothetical protein
MNRLFGGDTPLFKAYVEGKRKRVLPWQLSIVDCFFIFNAFRTCTDTNTPLALTRVSDNGNQIEEVSAGNAYDVYGIDRDADGHEVVLTQPQSGATCYWDLHERFVVLTGSDEFLLSACPFPDDIEMHRFIEAMEFSEQFEQYGSAHVVYDLIKNA